MLTRVRRRRIDDGDVVALPRLTTVTPEAMPPLSPAAAAGSTRHWRTRDGRIALYGYSGAGARWLHVPDLATFRFTSPDEVTAIVAGGAADGRILDAYWRTVLPLALQSFGCEVLHASAVVGRRGVAAFCALPETGKSTIAYGLTRRGYAPWADDAVVFRESEGRLHAIPLSFRLRLRPPSASYFARHGEPAASEVARRSGGRRRRLSHVFVLERSPRAAGATVEVHRLAPGAALSAVLTHAHSFSEDDPARKRRLVEQYLALVAGVPVFRVRFPDDLERLGDLLDRLEGALA